jgi:hypothetical protein
MSGAEKLQELCTCDRPDRVERLRELLDARNDPNASLLFNKTPLHWLVSWATMNGRAESSIKKDVDGIYRRSLSLNRCDVIVKVPIPDIFCSCCDSVGPRS